VTPAQLAERATLGTLLVDPRQLDTVAGWLRPSDFAHWWHTEVYRALLANPQLAARDDAGATAEHVRAALVATLGYARSDPPGLHTLMRTAPLRPVAARYAAMVVEASIRRQVGGLSVHLLAAAVPDPALADLAMGASADNVPSSAHRVPESRSLRDVTAVVEPVLADLGAQWAAAATATSKPTTREHPTDPAGIVAGAFGGVVDADADARRTDRQRELAVVADRAVRTAPARSPADARADAARLVAALVTHPDLLDGVAGWLRPEEVARPPRAVYEAMLALHQQGLPIDPITVCWETQRASRARGAGPEAGELLRQLQAAERVNVDALIRAVAHDTLRRTAASAADGMRAAAANPGLTVGDVLDAAAWATQAVTRAARDLRAASNPSTTRDTSASTEPAAAITASTGRHDQEHRASGNRWRRARHLSPVDAPDRGVIR
jgi:replicative DNA helicase